MHVRVIIINVDTIGYAALAAASARRHLPFEITFIDCSRAKQQIEAGKNLARTLDIQYERWPLDIHGRTLDKIFRTTNSDLLILVDSDAEILDARPMLSEIDKGLCPEEYGIAWEQPTGPAIEARSPITLYMARPWIPFCAFAAPKVRKLLDDGVSFAAYRIQNDMLWLPAPMRNLLAYRRLFPGLRALKLQSLQSTQRQVDGWTAPYIDFDTGAALHRAADQHGMKLRQLDWANHGQTVFHVHGGTRRRLHFWMRNHNAGSESRNRALEKLQEKYGLEISETLLDEIRHAENSQ